MKWLNKLPYPGLVIVAVLLGLAPFTPEPHLLEKIRMLLQGGLTRPVDIFDLFLHGAPLLLLVLKIIYDQQQKSAKTKPGAGGWITTRMTAAPTAKTAPAANSAAFRRTAVRAAAALRSASSARRRSSAFPFGRAMAPHEVEWVRSLPSRTGNAGSGLPIPKPLRSTGDHLVGVGYGGHRREHGRRRTKFRLAEPDRSREAPFLDLAPYPVVEGDVRPHPGRFFGSLPGHLNLEGREGLSHLAEQFHHVDRRAGSESDQQELHGSGPGRIGTGARTFHPD